MSSTVGQQEEIISLSTERKNTFLLLIIANYHPPGEISALYIYRLVEGVDSNQIKSSKPIGFVIWVKILQDEEHIRLRYLISNFEQLLF